MTDKITQQIQQMYNQNGRNLQPLPDEVLKNLKAGYDKIYDGLVRLNMLRGAGMKMGAAMHVAMKYMQSYVENPNIVPDNNIKQHLYYIKALDTIDKSYLTMKPEIQNFELVVSPTQRAEYIANATRDVNNGMAIIQNIVRQYANERTRAQQVAFGNANDKKLTPWQMATRVLYINAQRQNHK